MKMMYLFQSRRFSHPNKMRAEKNYRQNPSTTLMFHTIHQQHQLWWSKHSNYIDAN